MRSHINWINLVTTLHNMKSETKKKIILLLLTGATLGFTHSPKQYFKVLKTSAKTWREINKYKLVRLIKEFYTERLVEYKEHKDGTTEVVLTEDGKQSALKYNFDDLQLKKAGAWDGAWRLVFFDIPEHKKVARNALRKKLQDLGFYQIQKSIFIFPHECKDEINFVTETLNLRPHVRYALVKHVTNESELKLKFNLY